MWNDEIRVMDQTLNNFDAFATASNLTRSQLLFWAGQHLNPRAPLYNMALVFELNGVVDPDHFQQAFQHLIDRSDVLRTIFVNTDRGVPQQKVLTELRYRVTYLDWSDHPEALSEFGKWARARSQATFDLASCLFECALVKISPDHFAWFFNQHHLMTDAWSVSVLYKSLAGLYQQLVNGIAVSNEPLPAFKEYVEYERTIQLDVNSVQAGTYWRQKQASLPGPPPLYGFRGYSDDTRSERISLSLGAGRSAQLRALAREADVRSWTQDLSLFNIFATALFAYLYRVSGQSDLALGCPAHNRPTVAFKETPGLFMEIFPLSTQVDKQESFSGLLQKVRRESNEFLRYAHAGSGTPELSRSFNVVLNYIHASFGEFAGIPVRSEWIHPGHCDPRHHLRLQVHDFDNSGSIQLHFDANCLVFDEETRGRIPDHFLKLLDAFIADRNQSIGKPPLASPAEFDKLAFELNSATGSAPSENLINLIEAQVKNRPGHPAIRFKGQLVDYQNLDQQANQLANFLIQNKVGPGQRIGIHLKRSPRLIVSILAILKTGAAYVPVAVDYPPDRVRYILEDAQVSLLLTQRELLAKVGQPASASLCLVEHEQDIKKCSGTSPEIPIGPGDLAYLMYTSGSTGNPKGVMISHESLINYIRWAGNYYALPDRPSMPLFTSIGFDLTVTSLFLPLTLGGQVVIYEENEMGPDLALLQVIEDNEVNAIKLTPSHLALLGHLELSHSRISTMILGGEDLRRDLTQSILKAFGNDLTIHNEYGPTEATVGCIVHQFDPAEDRSTSVPIGRPISNMQAYVLDSFGNPVPQGISGELYVSGNGLADGYWNRPELTAEKFITNPFRKGSQMYRTGDLARLNAHGQLEYLGRVDQQIKIGGIRIEPGEIESALASCAGVQSCVVVLQQRKPVHHDQPKKNCVRCGLTSHYPKVEFDEEGVCNLCRAFESYHQKAKQYFKTMDDLRSVFAGAGSSQRSYDCLALLSGGKDSTYALARLAEMGLKVLAFTLDNGYISEGAKENIRKVVDTLGVDHMFGRTPAMNAIFVDSLHRHHNVCDGCFKTIYTLSTQIALEKNIPFIVTGLSRGQFFETRLTEELFRGSKVDISRIDQTILDARKAYHRVDDAVYRLLDVSMFKKEDVFEKVQFVDFYRYCDVSLAEMLAYLDRRLPWVRPADTGRSTNCLINKAGIYVHKKQKGYSNYAYPYSWDVRVGHKNRDEALKEIEEEIEEQEVQEILREIGYTEAPDEHGREQMLVAYYVSDSEIPPESLTSYLAQRLPQYMIPVKFVHLEALPHTPNGKVDRQALSALKVGQAGTDRSYEAPRNEIEERLTELWADVLYIDRVGIHENFLSLGGYSLAAIRLMARINEAFDLQLPVNRIFEFPTIASLSEYVEQTITTMLEDFERAGLNKD